MQRGYSDVVYESQKMAKLLDRAYRVAQTEARILITGESGTGKELLAHKIHEASERKSRSFVPLNCPGLTESLLESELFGHEKGAFTDAKEERVGLLARADQGTLLIDEISEASRRLQGIFLRFLETGEVQRVGYRGSRFPNIDTRVIALSNRDLEMMVSVDEFRRDLYFRLNVVHFHLPPPKGKN